MLVQESPDADNCQETIRERKFGLLDANGVDALAHLAEPPMQFPMAEVFSPELDYQSDRSPDDHHELSAASQPKRSDSVEYSRTALTKRRV
jgi:hypothetical protein